MLSAAREDKDSDSVDGEASGTKDGDGKKKAVFKVDGVLLNYTREGQNMMNSIFRYQAL